MRSKADETLILFDSYAVRIRKLPEHIQIFVKLLVSQIFFNADNPCGPFITITLLPQPKAHPDFLESQFSPQYANFASPYCENKDPSNVSTCTSPENVQCGSLSLSVNSTENRNWVWRHDI